MPPRKQPGRGGSRGRGRGVGPRARVDRKTLQLCGQVAETLNLVLAEEPDDVLRGLYVAGVEPAPDDSRLLVTVESLPADRPDPARALARLELASAHLREEVARAITRRRVPSLAFRFATPAAGAAQDVGRIQGPGSRSPESG